LITIGISPVAFLGIRWYGVFVALAALVLVLWMLWEVRKGANLSYNTILTAALVGIPSAIIFSRLLHVIDRWGYYSQNPGQILGTDGLTFYGAILGAALGIWIYSKFSNFNYGYLADLVAPAILLAHAVGRIGCTINGCCHGMATSLPWGIIYPSSHYTDGWSYFVDPKFVGIPIHPTQIYEIIYNLLAFTVLLKLRGHLKYDGSLFLIYLTLYALWRVGGDFLRVGTPFLFGLHQAQVVSIVILAITVPLLVYRAYYRRL